MQDHSAFFLEPQSIYQRRYEALRAFYVQRERAAQVARRFGYTLNSFNSLRRDFASRRHPDAFFRTLERHPWSKTSSKEARLKDRIIQLRKRYWSVYDIQSELRGEGYELQISAIHRILRREGFRKLPRRLEKERRAAAFGRKGDSGERRG